MRQQDGHLPPGHCPVIEPSPGRLHCVGGADRDDVEPIAQTLAVRAGCPDGPHPLLSLMSKFGVTINPFLIATVCWAVWRASPRVTQPTGQRDTFAKFVKVRPSGSGVAAGLQFSENFLGVLPEFRCGRTRRPRRAMEVRRCGDHRDAGLCVRPSGTSTMPPAAWNCSSATMSSRRVDRRPEEIRLGREDLRPFVQRSGREDLVQLGDDFRRVDGAGTGIAESRVGQPLGAADGATQRGPVPVASSPTIQNRRPSPAA